MIEYKEKSFVTCTMVWVYGMTWCIICKQIEYRLIFTFEKINFYLNIGIYTGTGTSVLLYIFISSWILSFRMPIALRFTLVNVPVFALY